MTWLKPPESSPLWLRAGEKPTEYLYEVKPAPARPRGLESVLSWDLDAWPEDIPKRPDRVLYLGALEWSWSPAHSRFDSYYLSYTDSLWVMYLHEFSDGYGGTWEWFPYSVSKRVSVDDRAVGYWMVYDLLRADSTIHELDRYHFVSAEGLLKVGDFAEIGDLIWKDSEHDHF